MRITASRDPVALDATAMRLIGLDPAVCKHVVHAGKIGLGSWAESEIEVDGPFAELRTTAEPAVEDWAIKTLNLVARSPFLTRNLLLNDRVFYPVRRVVTALRSVVHGR